MPDADRLTPRKLSSLACDAQFWSLRLVEERAACYSVRKNVAQPPFLLVDRGAMLTVYDRGGHGYAATSDLSTSGLQAALDRACRSASRRDLFSRRHRQIDRARKELCQPDSGRCWGN